MQERPRTWVLEQLVEPAGAKLRVVLDEITAVLHRAGRHARCLEALGHVAGRSRRRPRVIAASISVDVLRLRLGRCRESTVVGRGPDARSPRTARCQATSSGTVTATQRSGPRHRYTPSGAAAARTGGRSAASRLRSAPEDRVRSAPPSPPAPTGRRHNPSPVRRRSIRAASVAKAAWWPATMSARPWTIGAECGTVEGERGEPGQRSDGVGVRHVVAPRPGSAEPGHADDDEPWVARLQHLWHRCPYGRARRR